MYVPLIQCRGWSAILTLYHTINSLSAACLVQLILARNLKKCVVHSRSVTKSWSVLPEHHNQNTHQLRISPEVIAGQNYQFITSGTSDYYQLHSNKSTMKNISSKTPQET